MGFFVHNCRMVRNGHRLAASCQLSCQLLKLANLSERFDELIKSAISANHRCSCRHSLHPTERWISVRPGQPVRAHRSLPAQDLGHILPQPSFVPDDPELGAGPPLLVAGALPAWSATRTMPMAIEVSHPDVVIDTLGHRDEPDALAGDHGQRIARPARRACGPVEGIGKRHGRQDTNGGRSGCDCEHSIATPQSLPSYAASWCS